MKILYSLVFAFSFFVMSPQVFAQNEVITGVKDAMKSGSSKELSRFFNEMVEINIEGDKKSYSRTQAEFVIKDFFKKYPPSDFQFIHQGASKEGIKYAIGKYSYANGSFRVLVLIKQYKGNYQVDLVDFTDE